MQGTPVSKPDGTPLARQPGMKSNASTREKSDSLSNPEAAQVVPREEVMENTNLVSENAREGVAVLTPHGPIVSKPDLEPFHSHLARLAKRGPISVVIDLSRQKWVGAAMLGELVRAQNMLQSTGGDLRLAAASGKTTDTGWRDCESVAARGAK